MKCDHGHNGNKTALNQQGFHEIFRHDSGLWISGFWFSRSFLFPATIPITNAGRDRSQIDKQQMYRCKWNRKSSKGRIQDCQNTCHVAGKQELNGIPDVTVYISSVCHGFDNGSKLSYTPENHGSSIFGNFRTGNAHSHTDICFFQCRSIIDTITGHGNDIACRLCHASTMRILFSGDTRAYTNLCNVLIQFCFCHGIQFCSCHCHISLFKNTNLLCNGSCRDLVVTGDHNGADTCTFCAEQLP